MTNWGKGEGTPATGGSPDTLSLEAPDWPGTKVTDDAQLPGLAGENGRGIEKVPGPLTVTRCSVAGRPASAEARLETLKTNVAGLTVPVSTARKMMVVCPVVPRAGDIVTDSVNPSTLPVAGRPEGTGAVVVDPLAVVEVELPELEQPATAGMVRASRTAATGAVLSRNIWPAYCSTSVVPWLFGGDFRR